jgi:hypothetical protein
MLQRAILLGFRSALVLPLDQSLCRRKLSEMPPPRGGGFSRLCTRLRCFNHVLVSMIFIRQWCTSPFGVLKELARRFFLLVNMEWVDRNPSCACVLALFVGEFVELCTA